MGLTDDFGRVTLSPGSAGSYILTVSRIGYEIRGSWGIALTQSETSALTLFVGGTRVLLPTVTVEGESKCGDPAFAGRAEAAALWEQAQTALRAAWLAERGGQEYRRQLTSRTLSLDGTIIRESAWPAQLATGPPFRSPPSALLLKDGFTQRSGEALTYFAPDANLLLSEEFLDQYCFRLVPGPDSMPAWTGLGFSPAERSANTTSVAGVLWLDRVTAQLHSIEFTYLGPGNQAVDAGRGWVVIQRSPRGGAFISVWAIRLPRLGRRPGGAGLATVIGFEETGGTARPPGEHLATSHSVLTGFVFDSLSNGGLPGVVVSVAGSPDSAVTDSVGAFGLSIAATGRRQVRLRHPLLNAVADSSEMPVDLSPETTAHLVATLPSPRTLAVRLCGATLGANAVVGQVAQALGEAVTIEGAWIVGVPGGPTIRRTTETAFAGPGGLWALCDLQGATTVQLRHGVGNSRNRYARLDIGPTEMRWVSLVEGTVARTQGVSGILLDAESGEPIAGAELVALESNIVRAIGQDGSFSLSGLSPGKHRLRARALGYAPVDTTIELGGEDLVGLRVSLKRLAVSLPELRTEAASSSLRHTGFDDRHLTTSGRFISRESLVREEHSSLANILDRIPRVSMIRAGSEVAAASSLRVSLSETTYPKPWPSACYMTVYLEGIRVWSPDGTAPRPYNLNQHPVASIEGIEVYTGADTPAQFGGTGSHCGTIVLWLRRT